MSNHKTADFLRLQSAHAEGREAEDPNLRRLRTLLGQPMLWAPEEAELRHLSGMYGITLRWERIDLQQFR